MLQPFKIFETKLFFAMLFLSMALGCTSKLIVNTNTYVYPNEVTLNYELSEPIKKENRKLLLIIPDFADSINYFQNPLTKELVANNYQILIPKRHGNNYSEQEMYDVYEERLNHIIYITEKLLKENKVNTSNRFVIYGNSEGAYIAAGLLKKLKPDYFILQNNTSENFIYATKMVLMDSNQTQLERIKKRTLLTPKELKDFISNIENKTLNVTSFEGKKAGNWSSYVKMRLSHMLFINFISGLQISDSTYLYTSKTDLAAYKKLLEIRNPKIEMLEWQHPLFSKKKLNDPLKAKIMEAFGVEMY